MKIQKLELPDRITSALHDAGYTTVRSITGTSDVILLKIPGIGPASLEKLKGALDG